MWTPQPQSKDVQRIFTLFKQEPQERFLPSFCSGGMRNILSETQKSSLRRELPSVYCLLTRTFSLKFLHVYDANVLYQCKNPQGSLALHISLMRNEGARWAADTSLQRLNMRILARSYYAHFMSNIFPKLHFKNTCQDVLNPTLTFTENTLKC